MTKSKSIKFVDSLPEKIVPPLGLVSQLQLDREAAVFLLNAIELSRAIRCGEYTKVDLSYSHKRRNPKAKNVVLNTIELKMTQGMNRRFMLPLSEAEAVTIVENAKRELGIIP